MAHCTTQPGIWTAASATSLQTYKQGQLQKPLLLLKPTISSSSSKPLALGIWPESPLSGLFVYFQPTKTLVRTANGFISEGIS